MQNRIRLYFFRRKDGLRNFGDELSPKIVELVTGRQVVWSHPLRADLAALGSIMQRVLRHRSKRWFTAFGRPIRIWGTGFIEAGETVDSRGLDILALRGPLSAARMRDVAAVAFGDPGLLTNRLLERPEPKRYAWGIIPHYRDLDNPRIRQLLDRTPNAVLVSVRDDPMDVIRLIRRCERIASTAMHGLIAADSFGIPNWRISVSDRVYGGDFKFLDYSRAIGRPDLLPVPLPEDDNLEALTCRAADFGYLARVGEHAEALAARLAAAF